jgi:spermidine synthase
VLILGLGGGSAARIIRELSPSARITGVEFDAEVVRVARRWFDLDGLGIEIVQGDARRYLERTRRRFDFIVEDVFIGSGRAVHKPDWLPSPGLTLATRRLKPGGLLVSNAIDEAAAVGRAMRDLFTSTLRIDMEDYDTRILAGADFQLSGRVLRSALSKEPILGPAARGFTIRAC